MINNKQSISEDLKFSSQSGKSLIEVILVVVIVIIVATFTVAQYRSSREQFNRQNIARQLKISLERARFDSVKRRTFDEPTQAKVIVNNSWFALMTDANGSGTIDASDREVTDLGSLDISITGQNMAFPVTLSYNQRGNVEATGSDGAAVNPIFYICNGTCTSATITPVNSNIVLVSPAGTVDLLAGNAPLPSFSNPVVSAVAGGSDINCLTAISSAGCVTPTPTPASTATPTPTPTPTVTPTSTATPTTSPTPIICQTDQKPSLTGCSCQYPMTVKKNGKCN